MSIAVHYKVERQQQFQTFKQFHLILAKYATDTHENVHQEQTARNLSTKLIVYFNVLRLI